MKRKRSFFSKLWLVRAVEEENQFLEREARHGFRFHFVEPMLSERAAYGQPTARFGDC